MPSTPDPALLEQLRAALEATYEIEQELAGGMSRVFTATERALGRKVAIKVLPPELTAGVNRERFRREIQFAARLQHPHIVPLLAAGQVGDILYYTMPLVEGETLRARLDREGRLGSSTVLAILQDVVDALAYAHARGLVHRDIKPENILLQRHHALVTDFGVAKAITEALPGSGATTAGIAVGTPAYMAPEQLAADPAADHRVDLYAIGLLAYELLSGGSPFTGSSPQQTLARQLTERPTPPHIQRADVPPALSSLIMRCLEKDPAARWSSADELLQTLASVRITSAEMRGVAPTQRLAGVRAVPRPLMLGGALIFLLALAVGGYAMWGRGTSAGTGAVPAAPDGQVIVSLDSAKPPPVPLSPAPAAVAPSALTRADSEAIAAAVAKRLLAKRAPVVGLSQHQLDSIRSDMEKSVRDSVIKTLAAGRGSPSLGMLNGLTDARILEGRAPAFRVILPWVVDGSPDRSLRRLAASLTDSLFRQAGRRSMVRLVTGNAARIATQRLEGAGTPGYEPPGDVAVQGRVQPVGADSVEVVFTLQDAHDARIVKTLRHAVLKSDAGMLPAEVAPMVVSWIDNRELSGRSQRAVRFFTNRPALDSAMRAAQRLSDSIRKGLRPRPSPPIPPTR